MKMAMKIKNYLSVVLTILSCTCFGSFANASITEFTQANFEQMKQDNQGKQWLMLLWSVDCPPCFKELALIQTIRQKEPNINIAIVNVDTELEAEKQRASVLVSYGLTDLNNYYFADGMAARNRYLIDPTWYGELPRSYFVETNGTFHGKSGLVNEQLLSQWLLTDK